MRLQTPDSPHSLGTPQSVSIATISGDISPLVLPRLLSGQVSCSLCLKSRDCTSEEDMVSTTLGRSLSIVNTSADPGRVDSSDAALADHLKVLAMYLKELAKSFSSHFLMHPILVPANGYRDQRYYLFMHIGSYVKNMIYMMCQQRGTGCESASDATRLSALIRIGCNVTDAVYDRDSVQWQEIGYWWEKRSTGPTIDDERMFLTTLRKQGLVQLPQLGCCTCRTRFDVLHRSIFRLCLKLRLANVDYAFAETVRRQPDPD